MILVTGGAGYIGSHTVKHLLDCGYKVLVLDNLVYGHQEAVLNQNFILGDLQDKNLLDKVFSENKIQAVMHFAGFTYVGESVENPQKYYQNNVIASLNLLEAMLKHNVKKIVFSSTCAVYGNPNYMPLDEKHSLNPINPYGQTKLIIEKILEDYHQAYNLQYIALRYFNAAGAAKDSSIGESHNPESHLIPLVMQSILGKRAKIQVYGTNYDTPDGTCIRDYVHVDDLAKAHKLALKKLENYSGSLNIGTGQGTSVLEIIKTAEKISGLTCPTEFVAKRAGDPAILYASSKLAKDILGWEAKYTKIEDVLLSAWNWEKNRVF